MRDRCNNPNRKDWMHYGGRGIYVDSRWESFENFLLDMGPRPSNKHSLDRIYNDGPYSRENCRWATDVEQKRNTSGNHLLTYNNETMTVVEWAERMGVPQSTLYKRLRIGWPVKDALCIPVYTKETQLLEHNGEVRSLVKWATVVGIPYKTLFARINVYKWDVEKALTTPVTKSIAQYLDEIKKRMA